MLFHQLRSVHQLPPDYGRLIEAEAHLYNVGHFVNEARHHRHSMYLVANSDLPGFENRERMVIANLCRYHRKSMPQASHEAFAALPPEDRRAIVLLSPLLRLAVALDQSQEQRVSKVDAHTLPTGIELRIHSDDDLDIERWHAQGVAPVFQEVYGYPLTIRVKK
jgi:exopolyphosphatase/guanosine-5'-triphosphate,3'-diphosphate pyrophosphatase